MPTARARITPRDIQILAMLDIVPLTALQLRKVSQTWEEPFEARRTIRERLQRLDEAGLVRTWRYATTVPCQPTNYYTLSPEGYRLLHGPDARPPSKRHFAEVAISRHHHTQALADFLVHTWVAAPLAQVRIDCVHREGTLRLATGKESLLPDAAFELVDSDSRRLRFFVEIDCQSERILSRTPGDSIERKIRLYNRLQDALQDRFRVLFVVASGSRTRSEHILDAAAKLATNSARTLVCAVTLPTFLSRSHALTAPLFLDHQRNLQSLVPTPMAAPRPQHNESLGLATLPHLVPS